MATLYVMIGPPGSGKSTWANSFRQSRTRTLYVSRDKIRFELLKEGEHYFAHEDQVQRIFIESIVYGLQHDVDVIADATHLSRGSRNKLIKALEAQGMGADQYELVFVFMATDTQTCVDRDGLREGRAHVTESVVRKMASQCTLPLLTDFSNCKGVWVIHA